MRLTFIVFLVTLACVDLCGQSKQIEAAKDYEYALIDYRNNHYKSAQQHLYNSISKYPTDKAYYLQGMIFQAMDKNLRAVAAFEAVLSLNPEYLEAKFQKALIYLKYGDADKAVEDLTGLIDYQGTIATQGIFYQLDNQGSSQNRIMTVSGMRANYYLYRGKGYMKLRKYDLALEDFDKSLSLENLAETLVSRALVYVALNEQDKAKNDLLEAIAISPSDELAWYNLALNDPNIMVPSEFLEAEGFAPIISLLASRALEKEDYGLALKYFEQSIQQDSTDALTLINRGRIFIKVGQYDLARRDFVNARELDYSRAECWYLIANTYFYERNFERALAYYDQYLAFDYSSGMVWYNAAVCHLELDQEDDACHYLKRASDNGMERADLLITEYCE